MPLLFPAKTTPPCAYWKLLLFILKLLCPAMVLLGLLINEIDELAMMAGFFLENLGRLLLLVMMPSDDSDCYWWEGVDFLPAGVFRFCCIKSWNSCSSCSCFFSYFFVANERNDLILYPRCYLFQINLTINQAIIKRERTKQYSFYLWALVRRQ